MNSRTEISLIQGPAGSLECAVDESPLNVSEGQWPPLAVIAHPHPLHGGTFNNKVVTTLVRAFNQAGYRCVRFNFRGIGASEGTWDEGRGEIDDMMAVVRAFHQSGQALALAGFSFGSYVSSHVAQQLGSAVQRLVLIGPATSNFKVADVPAHTLVVHGEQDEVVPLSATFDWARPQNLPVTVVPGVGHFFHGQLTLLKSLVLTHLSTPLGE